MKKNKAESLRKHLLLFTACTMVGGGVTLSAASAQTASSSSSSSTAQTDQSSAYKLSTVKVIYKKLLVREKDIPNAISHLSQKEIQSEGTTTGSIQTLLKQTPSVNAYSQGPGQSAPTLSIRGVRNSELSETMDGIPITDLMNGSGNYLSNNIGSPVTLGEIDGVNVYPGVAPPERQGFGTVGGTVAYSSSQATPTPYAILEGGYGSFSTSHEGFTINTGKMYDSADAPRAMLKYDQSQTAGYVKNTPAKYHDMLFNINKPYDDGLSKVSLTVIYNQGKGNVQSQPTPTDLINKYGYTYNFPYSLGYDTQAGQFLSTILHDSTYINEHMIFDGSLFYLHSSDSMDLYNNPQNLVDNYNNVTPYQGNIQNPFSFYGPVGPSALAIEQQELLTDPNAYFTSPHDSVGYDPLMFAPAGSSTSDPTSYAYGEDYEKRYSHTNEIGITPKLNIFLPHNTIAIGALIAKESGSGSDYVYGSNNMPEINGYNSITYGGGEQRTVYEAYLQDKVDLMDDKLHIVGGLRVTSAYSSHINVETNTVYKPYKLTNFTKSGDPYLGISYDLPDHFIAYGSYGKSEVFAPVDDYKLGSSGTTTAPTPEIVHLYEAGLRYDTPKFYANVDYYYQKITDAFGFFDDFKTDEQIYGNPGSELFSGWEMSAQYQVTPEFQVFASGSYNRAQYLADYSAFDTVQEDQFGVAYRGTPLSNTPDWLANFGFEEDHGPYSIRMTGQYTGREYTTYDLSTNDPITNGATVTNTAIQNPANVVFNLLLTYKMKVNYGRLKELTFSLNGKNIFNEHYYTYTYNQYMPIGGNYGSPYPTISNALIGPPVSVMFDVSAKF